MVPTAWIAVVSASRPRRLGRGSSGIELDLWKTDAIGYFFAIPGNHSSEALVRSTWGTAAPERVLMDPANQYRAKAWECLSLAENMNDPERRAEMLRFAKLWMNLSEPLGEVPGAYELPRRH